MNGGKTAATALCACGHLVLVHTLKDGTRRECTHQDDKGLCKCERPH